MNDEITAWLLGDDNPAVKFRTQTELLGQNCDIGPAKEWIFGRLPENWHETDGLWYVYYVTALAECGLSNADISPKYMEKAFDVLTNNLECGCADFMLATALVKLGYDLRNIVGDLAAHILPDGGFLCLHRKNKLKYTPKSCYKANLHALMFLSECTKKGVDTTPLHGLIGYFLDRGIFYKSTDRTALVLDGREGWRTIDAFYPFEVMRGTPTKSYLPKERVGKPSKWATLYAMIAEKWRGAGVNGG